MSITKHPNQSMLVAISFGVAAILASNCPLIEQEVKVKVGSANLRDHGFYDLPTMAGLYIWEGEEPDDGDFTWKGAFRPAGVVEAMAVLEGSAA